MVRRLRAQRLLLGAGRRACSRSTCCRATACTRSGLELDAIAAVVIGGTLLTGGVGYVVGTLFGVLILGIIQTLIMFDGTLSSWWTRIVIGALLFAFCLLQRLFESRYHVATCLSASTRA